MTSPAPTTLLRAATAIAGAALALTASPVHAASWTPLTDHGSSLDQVGLTRTADGTLHVGALEHPTASTVDLVHRTISPTLQVGAKEPVTSGWANMASPEVLDNVEGFGMIFAGQRSTDVNDPYHEGRAVAAHLINGAWELTPPFTALPGPAYAADRVAAIYDANDNNTLVMAWGTADGLQTHVGADPTFPNAPLQTVCCAYGAAMAPGPTIAWYSNQNGAHGIRVHTADDQTLVAPKSAKAVGEKVGLSGDGSYLGYATGKKVAIWTVAAPKPSITRTAPGAAHVELADVADGRMWLFWNQGRTLKAARTNKARTVLGATVSIKSKTELDALNGNGDLGPLDVVATRAKAGAALTRVLPGLTIVKTKHGYKALDAGATVKGAKITKTKHKVTASKAGYTPATVKR